MKALTHYIKNFILLLFWVPVFVCTEAQTPNGQAYPNPPTQTVKPMPAAYSGAIPLNTVRVWKATKPLQHDTAISSRYAAVSDVQQVTQYFDGMGRPLQTVTEKITPGGKDMVTPVYYDEVGNESYKYLPYISPSSDGNFKSNPFNEQNTFLKAVHNPANNADGEKFFYTRTDYEASPLNRVAKVYAAGNSWAGSGAGVGSQYLVNTTADSVRIWNISAAGSTPASPGFYTAGQLFKNVSTDEKGYDAVEYKDKAGNVILKKVEMTTTSSAGSAGWYNTYYVYDDLQNLRYIIQPKGTDWLKTNNWTFDNALWRNSTIAKELCFSYEYDGRKRMIVKRIPGAGEIWQVYDARDRLVMVQDSVNRAQGRWLFTKYDSLNRAVLTGLWPTTGDRGYHQNLAKASASYPSPAAGSYTLLTETYYDNYNWVGSSGSGLSSALITGNGVTGTTWFYTASNTVFPYPQAITTGSAKGEVTGVKTAVMGTATYLYVVNFYDNKGRLIQTHRTNYSGGKDTTTIQYSFSGQVLRTLECHQKAGPNAQGYRVLTKMEYDDGGRLTKVYKKTGNSPEVAIVENKYDEFGQMVQKNIGKVRNSSNQNTYTTAPLDSLKYDYNIRGWMSGINKSYARGESGGTGWFGMELNYDFGFTTSELVGNIAGIRWKSKGDGEQRAYGFTYDAANRLTRANFTQYTGGAWNVSAGVDFSVPLINYDPNGNITKLQQKGQVLTSSPTIDSLDYGYVANSNRLNYVNDKTNNTNSRLGDFKEITNNTSQDYWYDGNGNLTQDNNKNINSIRYNHLNLPDSIAVTGKGYIRYIYDAAGNKLRKITVDNTVSRTTRTDYLGSFVYENDTLQFALHEEGRARPKRANYSDTMYYDYFEKDHLGNVRVVLTDELHQNIYPAATLEGSISTDGAPNAIYKEKDYYTINPANVVDQSLATNITAYQNHNGNPPPNINPNSNITANSQKLYRLIATTGGVSGLGMTLKVMSGDRIDIFGKSYYFENNTAGANYNIPALDIFTGLLGAPGGAASKGYTAAQLNTGAIASAVSGFLTDPNRSSGVTTVPKAYINYILFDENFKYVGGSFSRVGAANAVKSHYADAQLQNIPVTKNGYLYVYVSNESPVNVFFDNLQVIHTRGPLVEETHYYPFGLVQQGISSKALKSDYPVNKNLYASKELQDQEFADGSGLDLYDYGARFYDAQIGRWHKTDNEAELYFATSPYVYALNQPTNAIDPDGNLVIFINGNHFGEKGHKYWTAKNYYTTTRKIGEPVPQGYRTINGRGTTVLYGKDRYFDYEVMDQLNDQHAPRYYDGSGGGWHPLGDGTSEYPGRQSATAAGREQMGYEKGKEDAAEIIANLERDKSTGNIIETIKIVTHSMGGAYGKGFVRALKEYIQTLPAEQQQQVKIEQVVDFDPYQGKDITADGQTPTFQFIHYGLIANQKEKGNVEQKKSKSSSNAHSIFSFFVDISQLKSGVYKWNPVTRTWDLQP